MSDNDDMDLAAAAIVWAGQFEADVRHALNGDPAGDAFHLTGMVFDETRGLKILHTPVPPGYGTTDEQFVRHVEQPVLVELLARTYRNRFRRLDVATGIVRPIAPAWRDVLAKHYPHLIACEIYIGDGWADLFFAMCAMIDESGETVKFRQITEKFSTLHSYWDGDHRGRASEISESAKMWSAIICEDCGAPGARGGIGRQRTMCAVHLAEYDAR